MLDELDLCVYIDDENESKIKRRGPTKLALNRIIDKNEIYELVDTKLGKCKKYLKCELYLNEEETSGFRTNLSITCKGYNKAKSLLLRKI